MTTTTRTSPQSGATTDARPRRVVVPLDGSAFAAEALRTGSVLASRFDVPLQAVAVSTDAPRVEDAAGRALLDASGAPLQVVVGHDPAEAILRHVDDLAPTIVCLSTHGHGRVAGTFLGSVAEDLLRRSPQPIVAVGPSSRPPAAGPEPLSVPRLVACVDGSESSEAVLPAAAAWATALDMALTILIVAEPAPMSPVPTTTPTRRVGHLDAQEAATYVARLAEQWSGRAPEVTGQVALDPVNPASGVEAHLRDDPAGLLALSTHARSGARRLWSGAVASSVIHASSIPVLVVPVGV